MFYCFKSTRTNNQGFTIKLKYERELSSQALNVGRSLGQGLGIMTTSVWKPAIGEKIRAEQELDNAVDKFAEKVIKDNETVGHLPREFCGILSHVAERYAWK